MKRWALIQNGLVSTITEQNNQPTTAGQWVDANGFNVGPGDTYNAGVFTKNFSTASIQAIDFWRRFTVAEREALQNLMATGTQAQKNKLNAFRDYVRTGMNVELWDDYIIASVTLLETVGIIAPGRAVVILQR